jgi:hypothetical protein
MHKFTTPETPISRTPNYPGSLATRPRRWTVKTPIGKSQIAIPTCKSSMSLETPKCSNPDSLQIADTCLVQDLRLRSFLGISGLMRSRFSCYENPDEANIPMTPLGSSSAPSGLNPAQLSRDLTADGISQFSSANPDHRFLLLEDFLRRLNVLSQNLLSNACACNSCSNLPRHKPPGLSFNDTTKVLYLLSFSTLILSEELARTPCAQRSTTSQVLNPSDSAHFLQQQSSISFAQINN